MTEEKILAYLNFGKNQKIDKSLMKIMFWFDFGFTTIILLYGFLLDYFKFDFYDYVYICGCVSIIIFFSIWCIIAKNPITEITFSTYLSFVTILKLLYAYIRFSPIEKSIKGYEVFGFFHIVIFVVFILMAVYMLLRFYQIWRDLKKHTIKHAKKNMEERQLGCIWIPIGIGSPMILVRLIQGSKIELQFGLGFSLWALMCIWIFFFLLALPKYIIIKKYKIADIFSYENSIIPKKK